MSQHQHLLRSRLCGSGVREHLKGITLIRFLFCLLFPAVLWRVLVQTFPMHVMGCLKSLDGVRQREQLPKCLEQLRVPGKFPVLNC
jgi:hypothetical protein